MSGTTQNIYKSGQSVSYVCKTGYTPIINVTTCQPTKIWSPSPVCNIVNCTVPDLNNGIYVRPSGTGTANTSEYAYNTTLKVQCNKWYDNTNGSNSFTCQEDGLWSRSPPQCVKILCNDSTDVSHASINNYPELGVGDKGNVSYNSTYFYLTEGSTEVTCTESRRFTWTTTPQFGKVSYILHWTNSCYILHIFPSSRNQLLHLSLPQIIYFYIQKHF